MISRLMAMEPSQADAEMKRLLVAQFGLATGTCLYAMFNEAFEAGFGAAIDGIQEALALRPDLSGHDILRGVATMQGRVSETAQ